MKKVLFTATYDSHIESFHIPYLKYFHDNGYEVHVATSNKGKIMYCDKKIIIPFKDDVLENKKAIKELKKVIDENSYDVIHTHTFIASVVTRIAAKKAFKKGTRIIYTAHGFNFYSGSSRKSWLFYYRIERRLAKYTDTLITINKEDYQLAKNCFTSCKDIVYVPGVGLDEDKLNFKMLKREKSLLRMSLGIEDSDFIILYPANLNKNKNQEMIINVMEDLVCEHNDIHLLLPGNGNMLKEYKKLVKDKKLRGNIHFLGIRNDIPALLKISNMALSTSKKEGLPLNILESMYMGLPIVATNCKGNKDLIKNGKNGYLVELNNQYDLKNKILKIYNNELDLESVRENNLKYVKPYTLEEVSKKMSSIYKI